MRQNILGKMPTNSDRLGKYRAKRSADRTPEPFGGGASAGGRSFVVQKHAARRLHYDFRLEWNGVLLSWAVPNGPSRNPADKQLAVHVEDHPIEYAEFEGVIPAGNYGAGEVIVWDRGSFTFLEDPDEGMEKGKLLFELRGQKLKGRWTLVKIKKAEKEWLLIKERDGFAGENGQDFPDDSVLSGLTLEDLRAGTSPGTEIERELREHNAPAKRVAAHDVEFMLAETRDQPFTREDWLFELKYDGYRLLLAKENDEAVVLTRNAKDGSGTFPEIARAVAALPFEHIVLDGEVVVQDEDGKPNFQRLQQRGRYLRAIDGKVAAAEHPATFFDFDLLAFGDFDLRSLPLRDRKKLLQRVLPKAGILRFAEHIETRGEDFFRAAEQMGLEGIVAKKASSKYRGGRSTEWYKLRIDHSDDFVIVGYTAPRGSRAAFGALHLAIHRGGQLTYAGSVGTGFNEKQLTTIKAMLDPHVQKAPAFVGLPIGKGHTWVTPKYVCQVRFKEVTADFLLRHPVFERLRDDKKPEDCVYRGAIEDDFEQEEESAEELEADDEESAPAAPAPVVQFSNLDKIFFPEHGYTKGDLVEYYRGIAPWLLPYLRDRPVTLTRYPDGIHGKSFFQKDAPEWTPQWIRTALMWSEEAQREVNQFICDDEPTLLYLANSGTIPLHIASSRLSTLEKPDWCSLDLDPKEAPFERVIEVALVTRELCEAIGLPSFVKTSGSSGLHVLVPLGTQCTHDQAKLLGELLARAIAKQRPDIATVERVIGKRAGRVYVDFLQNGHGKLLVSPFCVRPLPGAPVSLPITWDDVKPGLTATTFTIRNAVARMRELGDPMSGVMKARPKLVRALTKLQERF
jgi:bifunctional non-homologous end joining protein LigD